MDSKTLALIVKGIDEASTVLRGVKDGVSELGSEAVGASKDLQPLGKGLTAVGAAGAALISITALTAARVEVLGTVLYTVGETAGYTEGQLDDLEGGVTGLGITTGAARQGLVQMMQAELDLAEATDIASIAQDAAVIANVNSSAAYETLVRGLLTGRSVLLKSLGLTVDFNAAYKRRAELLGVNVLALSASEKMTARLNEVKRAGAIIEGTYEAAMGDVGKKLTSMPRLTEEAGRALGQAYLPAMELAVDATSDMLKAFIALDPEQQKGIARFIATGTAVTGLGGAIILALPKIAAMKTAMTALNLSMLGPVGLVVGGLAAVYAIAQLPVPLTHAAESTAKLNEASILLDGTVGSLTVTEEDLRRQLDATKVAQSDLTDGWMASHPELVMARTLTDGWATALHDAGGELVDLADVTLDYSTEMGLLTDAIRGPIKKANEGYQEQVEDVEQAILDETETLGELITKHGLYDDSVITSQGKINDLEGELGELADQHEDTINRILYDIVLAQLAIGGWTKADHDLALAIALDMDIIDQEYYDAAVEVSGYIDDYINGASVDEITEKILGVTDDILDIGPAAETAGTAIPPGLRKAESGFNDIDAWARDSAHWIGQIPRNVDIHTTYSSTGTPPGHYPEQYQHGTDYVPRTGLAYLHEGEAVLTKAENRQRGGGGSRVTIHNHFGRDSVRSDTDIQAIIDGVQRSMELQGMRARIA